MLLVSGLNLLHSSYRMMRCPAGGDGAGRELVWCGGATCGTFAWGRAGGHGLMLCPFVVLVQLCLWEGRDVR